MIKCIGLAAPGCYGNSKSTLLCTKKLDLLWVHVCCTLLYILDCVLYMLHLICLLPRSSKSTMRDLVDVDQLSVPSYLSCSWSFMVNIIHHFRKKTWISVGGWVQTVEYGDLIEIVYECVVSHIWTHCHTLCLSRHFTTATDMSCFEAG